MGTKRRGRSRLTVVLADFLLLSWATVTWGQARPGDPPSFGADLRLRNDSENNPYLTRADPPGHTHSFERLRIRAWNAFLPSERFELQVRFTWEGRHYWKPDSKGEWDRSDLVFDNLFARIRLESLPVTLTLGRQDVAFGEGWLISDGTPLDGPRTSFFDALRATVDLNEIGSKLDLIYIDQAARSGHRLPTLGVQGKTLMEQDERGAIVYLTRRGPEDSQEHAYLIYKRDRTVLPSGDNGEVYTVGGVLQRTFRGGLSARTEGAYQFGTRRNAMMFLGGNGTLSAWGWSGRISTPPGGIWKRQAWLGFEIQSGSDAGDSGIHQFDALWGRWARYSELFPDDLDRAGDRSNLWRVNLGGQCEPGKGWQVQANYHALFPYAHRFAGTAGFSEGGGFKGHLFTLLARYQHDRFWSGYLLLEGFLPGNYYQASPAGGPLRSRNDAATFFRAQAVYTF